MSATGAEDQTGGGSTASGSFSVACGLNNTVGIGGGWAFGYNNKAGTTNAGYGVAFGASNTASGPQGTAFGAGNIASGSASTAIGYSNTASGFLGTAIGRMNTVSGNYSTAVGYVNTASGYVSAVLGYGNNTSGGDYSTVLGYGNAVSGFHSVALGSQTAVTGANSIAMGHSAAAGGTVSNGFTNAGTTAIGTNALAGTTAASQPYATAVGFSAQANNVNASALGQSANASGANSTALGTGAAASGDNTIAAGNGANAAGLRSTAIGANASTFNSSTATGALSAVALGFGAIASENGSVAIGTRSVADVRNVVSVGAAGDERRIINVRGAVNPTDAVNLEQVQALIAAAATPRVASAHTGSRFPRAPNGILPAPHRQRVASLHESDGVAGLGDGSAGTAAPVTSLACEFGNGKVTTAVTAQSSGSAAFMPIQQTGLSFRQGGTAPGCVTLSFSAEVQAPGSSVMEVRAILDGSIEASPGPVLFAQQVDAFNSRGFSFFFANVAPGQHRVEVQFRNVGGNSFVRIGQRTTMVQFAK